MAKRAGAEVCRAINGSLPNLRRKLADRSFTLSGRSLCLDVQGLSMTVKSALSAQSNIVVCVQHKLAHSIHDCPTTLDIMIHAERRKLIVSLLPSLSMAVSLLALTLALVWSVGRNDPIIEELSRGPLVLIFCLLALWAWLLRRLPAHVINVVADLKDQSIDVVNGTFHVRTHRGVGVIGPLKHRAIIDGHAFDLAHIQDWERMIGQSVNARFAPTSEVLLSLEMAPADLNSAQQVGEFTLTEAEVKRLNLVAEGLSDKLIARELDLSPSTVRTYNSALFKKLGAENRDEAVKIARARALIDVD